MMTKDEISNIQPEALFCDGFDEAIIGLARRIGLEDVVAYDMEAVIGILMAEGLSEEDALEHFHYNVAGSYVGPFTPIFIQTSDYY